MSVDVISGDELLSDSFPYKEIENRMLWEVEGKVGTVLSVASMIIVVVNSCWYCIGVCASEEIESLNFCCY